MAHYHWKTLYDGMQADLGQRIRGHNDRYPKPQYKASYPRRLKKTEVNTLHNVLKAWCKQSAHNINAGRPVSNRVRTNNLDAQGGMGCKSNTARHLGKLAFAGFLLGDKAGDEAERRYLDQFTYPEGKGFGVIPRKAFHGTQADYELLIEPSLLPLGCLPAGSPFVSLTHFSMSDEAAEPSPASQSPAAPDDSPKGENFALIIAKTESSRIKELSQAASEAAEREAAKQALAQLFGQATASDPLTEDFEDGKRKEIGNLRPEDKGPAAGAEKNPAAEDLSGAAVLADQDAGTIFRRLFLSGQVLTAYAVLLVQMYCKKLAPAMRRSYVPAEVERGVKAATLLMAQFAEADQNQAFTRFSMTIDHMQEWLRRNPHKFVMQPSHWFHPDTHANILGAEKAWLQVYEARAGEFKDAKLLAKRVQDEERQADEALGCQSDLHRLALILKKKLMHQHPEDRRLRMADLQKWAADLRLLTRKDRRPVAEVEAVALWLMDSPHPDAKFWREQAGGFGIRSAAKFRKVYPQLLNQMQLSRLSQRQQTPSTRNP